jgi:hypothetical protein
VLSAQIVKGGLNVKVGYLKPVSVAMLFPVRHQWSNEIDCVEESTGLVPKITISYQITGSAPSQSNHGWEFDYSTKTFKLGSEELCNGKHFEIIEVNGMKISL